MIEVSHDGLSLRSYTDVRPWADINETSFKKNSDNSYLKKRTLQEDLTSNWCLQSFVLSVSASVLFISSVLTQNSIGFCDTCSYFNFSFHTFG